MCAGTALKRHPFRFVGPQIGDTRHYKHRGVAPRALAQLFADIADKPESTFNVQVSYMEIYNDRIFDLLAEHEGGVTGDFAVVEDRGPSGLGSYVKGLRRVPVTDEEQALDLLFQGEVRRTTAEHLLNKNSNRSHCIFTVYITQRSRLGSAEKVLTSKLHLVDLAGSERLKKTMAEDELRGGGTFDDSLKRESMYINKSLTYLEQCVVALTDKSRTHVPYRQTKLTNVLRDSLGGNCSTLMIACIWGEARHLEESISTLKLANRMVRVLVALMLSPKECAPPPICPAREEVCMLVVPPVAHVRCFRVAHLMRLHRCTCKTERPPM